MPDIITLLFLPACVLLATVLTRRGAKARKKRARETATWAARNGWRYRPEVRSAAAAFEGEPFSGNSGESREVLEGSHRGHDALVFRDSHSIQGADGHAKQHTFHVAALTVPAAAPLLEVKGRGLGDGMLAAVAGRASTTGDDAFDRIFQVSATDDEFARAVLTPQVRSWLIGLPLAWKLPFRFTNDRVLCWDRAVAAGGEPLLSTADFLAGLLDRVPGEAWDRAQRG